MHLDKMMSRLNLTLRTLSLLSTALLFATTASYAQSTELLKNGDFAIGIPTEDKSPSFNCKGWRRELWKQSTISSWLTNGKLDPTIGKGNQALQFRWGATTINQLFSARPHENYQFGIDTLNSGDEKSAWHPRISVQWFDASHAPIGKPEIIVEADVTTAPIKIWHRLQGTAHSPANTAYGKFLIEIIKRNEGAYFQATFFDNASVVGPAGNENRPPSFTSSPYSMRLDSIPETTRYEDSLLNYADDRDSDALAFTLVEGPQWLQVDTSGSMRGRPAIADIGKHQITVKVDDQRGGTDTQTLHIEVIGHLRLANLFDDEMVLQRNAPITVWGQALPYTAVAVTVASGYSAQSQSDASGNWKVELPAMPATRNGSTTLTVTSGPRTIHYANILVGDVWMCSGQSNMDWVLERTDGSAAEIAAAKHPNLRIAKTPQTNSNTAWDDLDARASWQIASPATVKRFSAVAYYFGKELLSEGIPIGLINSSQGGTRIEPWTATPEGAREKTFFNSRIMPYAQMPITGAIWYQGESNMGDGATYTDKMVKLIESWRSAWNRTPEQFPFYFVQLAPFKYKHGKPTQLPEMWAAQAAAAKQIPNTGMTVINDIGNLGNIHPTNKSPVGQRLGRLAKHGTYGHVDLLAHSPVPAKIEINGKALRVTFDNAGTELSTRDGKAPDWFEIAAKDGEFTPAKAQIEGQSVLLKATSIQNPVKIRFAWHETAEPNLINNAGLPASAFQLSKLESPQ